MDLIISHFAVGIVCFFIGMIFMFIIDCIRFTGLYDDNVTMKEELDKIDKSCEV